MPSREPNRPNVLFVLTDDQGYWAMGSAGNPEIRTPHLGRLAHTGIRFDNTPELKYVHRYPFGPHEFYDLAVDPDERNNLVDSPARQGQIQELKGQLDAWFVRYVDPAVDGVREPVTGKGQLGLAGPAGKGEPNFADDWYYLRSGDRSL
jgi:arylsulfatase A-like enzyme